MDEVGREFADTYFERTSHSTVLRIERTEFTKPSYGAMKETRNGELTEPIKDGSFEGITEVAVKQAYHCPAGDLFVTYPWGEQLKRLAPEFICAAWANALHELTMDHVTAIISAKGFPPFQCPVMRFVYVALATESGGEKNVYLLEQKIPDPFVKYIHNASAAITVEKTDAQYMVRAEFLAFSQHLQYWKTKKLAFISDFQGE